MPTPNPLIRIVLSGKVQVAFLAVVGTLLTILNVSPEKQGLWLLFIGGVFSLAVAIIWAWGYEDGKLKEGTVPEGSQAAAPPVQVNVNGPGGETSNATKPLLMLLPLLALVCGGCLPVTASDFDRLYAAKQAYDSAEAGFEAAIDTGVIKNKRDARPIQAALDGAYEVLGNAEAKLKAGDKLGFQFTLNSFQTALGKYRQYMLRSEVPGPQTRSDLWSKPPSSSRSSDFSNPRWSKLASGVSCSPRLNVARASAPKSTQNLTRLLLHVAIA